MKVFEYMRWRYGHDRHDTFIPTCPLCLDEQEADKQEKANA